MIVEGTEGTEFSKDYYIGKTNVRLVVINPTAQEKVDLLGWNKKPETEPNYLGERDGAKTVRIEANIVTKEGVRFSHSFFIENKEVVSKDGTKTQMCNNYGQFAYLPNTGELPENMSWFNIEGLRKSFKGEEEMVNFLTNLKDVRKNQKFYFENFSAMFNGDFSEVKSITSKNAVGILTGVKQTFGDDGTAKYTQVVYPKVFVKQYTKQEDSPNGKGGVYKGYSTLFTEALEGTRNAGGHLNVVYGTAPYTFTKIEDVTKLPWLTGDNAVTTAGQTTQAAF